jgi:agmatine/peptidylarginine deiminase
MDPLVRDANRHDSPRSPEAGRPDAAAGADHGVVRRLALAALATLVLGCDSAPPAAPARFLDDGLPLGTVPGEFERQQAMVVAWPRFAAAGAGPSSQNAIFDQDQLYCDIVAAVGKRMATVILVEDAQAEQRVTALLSQRQIAADGLRFLQIPFASEWIRDYGPLTFQNRAGAWGLLDAEFVEGPVGVYPYEDRMPSALGRLLQLPTVRVPLSIQHGNLLSNGRGLCLVTQKIVAENAGRGYDADDVRRVLAKFYGATEVVFLETLEGEPTGHVDMFATWTSADTVVIGQYPPEYDPVNAAILDRNAQRLSRAASAGGPVKVVRVPMPPRVPSRSGMELWTTYTNVAYANGVLLLPVYPRWASEAEAVAVETYQRLLPDWTIVKINAVPVLRTGGSIHCVTMNLPCLGALAEGKVEASAQSQRETHPAASDTKGVPWYGAWPTGDDANSVSVVRLAGTGASDEDLIAVGNLPEVRMLDLRDTRITDQGLRHLSRLRDLEVLVLTGTAVSDQGLEYLAGMSRLKVLCLDETQVTSRGLPLLQRFPRLGWLNLSRTAITAEGLSQLRACSALEVLIVDPCPVSPEDVQAFQASAPGIQVYDGTRRRPPFHSFAYQHFP